MRRTDIEVLIFDQTIIDTYCYLRLRSQDNDWIIHNLSKEVAEVAKDFDVLINLKKSYDNYSKGTHVTLSDRKFFHRAIEDFFRNYHLKKTDIMLDGNGLNQSIEESTTRIAEIVSDIYQKRGVYSIKA
jgi:hypothetical protein